MFFEKKKIINKPGNYNLNIIFLPNITQTQQNFKIKQNLKKDAGLLSEKWYKQNKLLIKNNLNHFIHQLNLTNSIFHAKSIIKAKKIIIENKSIPTSFYKIKPFNKITYKLANPELLLLNKIKNNKIINNNNTVWNNQVYKI